jgi:hypothetical protein
MPQRTASACPLPISRREHASHTSCHREPLLLVLSRFLGENTPRTHHAIENLFCWSSPDFSERTRLAHMPQRTASACPLPISRREHASHTSCHREPLLLVLSRFLGENTPRTHAAIRRVCRRMQQAVPSPWPPKQAQQAPAEAGQDTINRPSMIFRV